MTKGRWKRKIKKTCQDAGVYEPFFDAIIDTLADILEKRDTAQDQYMMSGGSAVVAHTNKGGATNLTANPCLKLVAELNRDALAYWRELCLTPAAFKRLNEPTKVMVKSKPQNALMRVLDSFSVEDDG